MRSMAKEQEIGAYSAYAIAVKHGYVGTEEEWIEEQERNRKASERAASDAENAKAAAQTAQKAAENAKADAESAKSAAEGSATSAGTSATQAAQSASDASNAKTEAQAAQKATEDAKAEATEVTKKVIEMLDDTGKISPEYLPGMEQIESDICEKVISQMKAFSNDTETFALHTINAINNVSNNMAVSSSDISTALSKTSSAMGALGNTYEQTIALVTSGTEIMQGQASKVARGLRTIGNNIANAAQGADTLEISVQGVTKQIDLLDSTTGDMRSTFDIMQDIFTNGWNDMTNAEQQALAISLAGY